MERAVGWRIQFDIWSDLELLPVRDAVPLIELFEFHNLNLDIWIKWILDVDPTSENLPVVNKNLHSDLTWHHPKRYFVKGLWHLVCLVFRIFQSCEILQLAPGEGEGWEASGEGEWNHGRRGGARDQAKAGESIQGEYQGDSLQILAEWHLGAI